MEFEQITKTDYVVGSNLFYFPLGHFRYCSSKIPYFQPLVVFNRIIYLTIQELIVTVQVVLISKPTSPAFHANICRENQFQGIQFLFIETNQNHPESLSYYQNIQQTQNDKVRQVPMRRLTKRTIQIIQISGTINAVK